MSRPVSENKLQRITMFLTIKQTESIKEKAAELNCSDNDIIRDCIDAYFGVKENLLKINKPVKEKKTNKTKDIKYCNTFFK